VGKGSLPGKKAYEIPRKLKGKGGGGGGGGGGKDIVTIEGSSRGCSKEKIFRKRKGKWRPGGRKNRITPGEAGGENSDRGAYLQLFQEGGSG